MVWAPDADSRAAVKFWLDCLQIVTVIAGIVTVAITVARYRQEQKVAFAEAAARAVEQVAREKEQIEAIRREMRRPYEERKLALYLDASRVLAHLAAVPETDRETNEARFWELYWGELAFVESPEVERLMVEFCDKEFPGKCSVGSISTADGPQGERVEAAIGLARRASDEIRKEWETLGR